jgi:hypothetical protein
VSDSTWKLTAALPPNETPEAPVKCEPSIVTVVPPLSGPADGLMLASCGTGAGIEALVRYVYSSAADVADVPPGVVTVTSTVLADGAAGMMAVSDVPDVTVTDGDGIVPKLTVVPPVKPAPTIVIEPPPAGVPALGLIEKTLGAASYV